jgi:hypothetical protein
MISQIVLRQIPQISQISYRLQSIIAPRMLVPDLVQSNMNLQARASSLATLLQAHSCRHRSGQNG